MINNLFNVAGLVIVLGLAVNTIWMSMLVYSETQLISSRKYVAEDMLNRIRKHCRLIGVSVMVMPVLSMAVGADVTFQLLHASHPDRRTAEISEPEIAIAIETEVALAEN